LPDEQNIGRLNIAMNEAVVVEMLEAQCNGLRHSGSLRGRQALTVMQPTFESGRLIGS
jgi:hypothetical protein